MASNRVYVHYPSKSGKPRIMLEKDTAKECRKYGIPSSHILNKYWEYKELNVPVLNYSEAANFLLYKKKKDEGNIL